MKYYLSSYKLGNETEKLKEMLRETSGKFVYCPNALDFTSADPERRQSHIEKDMDDLRALGVDIEVLDLKDYFGKEDALREKLLSLGGMYVSGGNSFVLRQAFFLSGLDKILLEMSDRDDFLYIAYSAGVCVLTPDMKAYAITDDATDFPYPQCTEQIWGGLNIVKFVFEPHYKSDHHESASTDKEVDYCVENKILFKAYRDGEVLILE